MKNEEIQYEIQALEKRFDKHLEIYANNGKELARVAVNQEWLMKFFWVFMTPVIGALIYIVFKL